MATQLRTRLFAAIVGALCMVSVHLPTAEGDESQPTKYRIDATLLVRPSKGPLQILSNPSVITIDRQPATIEVGQQQQVSIEGDEVVTLQTGIKCSFTPYRLENGDVKLDLNVELVHSDDSNDDEVITSKVGVRRIQRVPLGKSFTLPLRRLGKSRYRLAMVISEIPRVEGRSADARANKKDAFDDLNGIKRVIPLRLKTDDLRKAIDEWERFWLDDVPMPDHEVPFRSHGGVIHFHGGF